METSQRTLYTKICVDEMIHQLGCVLLRINFFVVSSLISPEGSFFRRIVTFGTFNMPPVSSGRDYAMIIIDYQIISIVIDQLSADQKLPHELMFFSIQLLNSQFQFSPQKFILYLGFPQHNTHKL